MTRQHHYRKSILTGRRRRMRKEVADRIREITAKTERAIVQGEFLPGAAHVEEVRDVALEDATVPQLREQAKSRGLTGYSKLTKAELIGLIRRSR